MKLKTLSIICATLACLVLTSNAFAEEQQSFIRKVLGGGVVSRSLQMSDGSYAYLGGHNITVVKDPLGKSISEASLTFVDLPCTSNGCGASLEGMVQTRDGFVLVGWYREGGYYSSTGGIVIKVNSEGQVQWGEVIGVDYFHTVIPAANGGFIVAGSRFGYPVLVKFSSAGKIRWSKSFDSFSSFLHLTPAVDGGFIVASVIEGPPNINGVNVLKMKSSGKLLWAITLENEEFILQELTTLSDQGYLLAGKASDPNKLLLVRLNADGTFHSKAAYSLDVPDFMVTSLAQTPDGSILIAGEIYKKTGSLDRGLLLKINDRQRLTLKKTFGFPGGYTSINSVFANQNGSYLLFGWGSDGFSDADALFVGLNSNGAAPGCGFFHDLKASKVKFGKINHKQLAITLKSSSIRPDEPFNVTSEPLNLDISNVCAN